MTFNEWMNQVDNEISNICGLSYLDLADIAYRDMFDAGCSFSEAATEALENEGFPLELL